MKKNKNTADRIKRMCLYLDRITGAPYYFIDSLPQKKKIKDFENYFPESTTLKKILKLKKFKLVGKPSKNLHFSNEPFFFAFNSVPEDKKKLEIGHYGGSYGFIEEKALLGTLGESVERSCLRKIPSSFIKGSRKELVAKKLHPISLEYFLNYDYATLKKWTINKTRKKLLSEQEDIVFDWYKGKDIFNKEILIPLPLLFVPETASNLETGLLRQPISTGAAFGTSKNGYDAKKRAIFEIIERDANMLNYLLFMRPPQIDLDNKELMEIKNKFSRHNLELKLFYTTLNLKIPSVVAVIIDQSERGPAISVGSKTSMTLKDSIMGAVEEAQQTREFIQASYLIKKDNLVNNAKEIVGLETRGLFWFSRDKIKKFDFLKGKTKIKASKIKSFDQGNDKNDLDFLLKLLRKQNLEIYFTDISLPPVKTSGFRVIKAIIPKLHPFHLNENFPYFYSKRLEKIAKANKNKLKINKYPHPFL